MVKTLSGEEHKVLAVPTKSRLGSMDLFKPVAFVAAALILVGLSFMGGMQYQKNRTKKTAASQVGGPNGQMRPNAQNGFGGRRRFGGQRPILGQVTTVDAASITIKGQTTDSTFTVTSQTVVTDNGQISSLSNIKIGDNVAIIASPTDPKQAARILLNPSYGGNPAASSTNSSDTSSIN